MQEIDNDFEAGPTVQESVSAPAADGPVEGSANGATSQAGDGSNRRDRRGRRFSWRDRRDQRRNRQRQNGAASEGEAAPDGSAAPLDGEAPPQVEGGASPPSEQAARDPRPDRQRGRENRGNRHGPRLKMSKTGIKVQSKRFGETWWAKRWISVLENMRMGTRLERGKSYARSGQVLSVEVQKGVVIAQVQGSRPKPYQVRIGVKGMSHKEWYRLARAVSSQAIFAAKLLSGEMPREIEQAFRREGLSLFPTKLSDLKTSCSCPDWSNPCKHIAAVYYLLGEEFDRDPFLIFKMRGMTREEFMAILGGRKTEIAQELMDAEAEIDADEEEPEPLPANPDDFWARRSPPENLLGELADPKATGLLKRVGNFPFWRGGEKFLDALQSTYMTASQRVKSTIAEF